MNTKIIGSDQHGPPRFAKQSDTTGNWHPPPRWRLWLLPIGIVISLHLLFHSSLKSTSS